jgi:hypothetical protein
MGTSVTTVAGSSVPGLPTRPSDGVSSSSVCPPTPHTQHLTTGVSK